MNTPVPIGAEEAERRFVDLLGRLCRLDGAARSAAVAPMTRGTAAGRVDRTCIDGGRGMMVTLHLPVGGRATYGLATATAERPAANARAWRRWPLDAPDRAGRSVIFGIPAEGDWTLARASLAPFDLPHGDVAELRLRGSVYMTSVAEPGSGGAWASFGLYRGQSPRRTLAALGRAEIWPELRRVTGDLLGRAVTEGTRPWSIALPAGRAPDAPDLLRVGTTVWGRLPETADKARRLAGQVAALGGDGTRAGAVYDLICRQSAAPRAVGAAAEFDFEDQRLTGAHYTFRVPDLNRPAVDFEGGT